MTLLGPSGSGKTTTLNVIAGFILPDAGGVFVNGIPVHSLPAHRRNIGVVFQNYALFPHMTVFDNIAFPLRQRKVGRAETKKKSRERWILFSFAGMTVAIHVNCQEVSSSG